MHIVTISVLRSRILENYFFSIWFVYARASMCKCASNSKKDCDRKFKFGIL